MKTLQIELDPIMDTPTAMHCTDCGETLAIDRCLVPECGTAAKGASWSGASAKYGEAPRAWTIAGRVD